jgi:hypothetical protein
VNKLQDPWDLIKVNLSVLDFGENIECCDKEFSHLEGQRAHGEEVIKTD